MYPTNDVATNGATPNVLPCLWLVSIKPPTVINHNTILTRWRPNGESWPINSFFYYHFDGQSVIHLPPRNQQGKKSRKEERHWMDPMTVRFLLLMRVCLKNAPCPISREQNLNLIRYALRKFANWGANRVTYARETIIISLKSSSFPCYIQQLWSICVVYFFDISS